VRRLNKSNSSICTIFARPPPADPQQQPETMSYGGDSYGGGGGGNSYGTGDPARDAQRQSYVYMSSSNFKLQSQLFVSLNPPLCTCVTPRSSSIQPAASRPFPPRRARPFLPPLPAG